MASREIAASDGVNIGQGVLTLWFILSVVLLVVEVAREGIAGLWRRFRRPPRSATSGV